MRSLQVQISSDTKSVIMQVEFNKEEKGEVFKRYFDERKAI